MNKIIRLLALILTFCMLAAVPTALAEEKEITELIANKSVERAGSDGFAASWWHTGDNIVLTTDSAHEGKNAVHAVASANESICQKVNGLVGGEKYTFSVWAYALSGELSFFTKFEIRDIGNTYLKGSPIVGYVTHAVDATRRWQKITYEFTTPENSDNGYFYIKFKDNTNMYLDEISIQGPANAAQTCDFVEVPAGSPDLAVNGDFEKYSDATGAEGWEVYLGWDGGAASVVKDEKRGNNVLRVESDGSTNPWGRLTLPVEPMATYQVTNLLKTEELSGSVKYKFEFYADPADPKAGYGEAQSQYFKGTYGTWQLVGSTVEAPSFAKYVKIYCRLYGGGVAYFDDITMHKVKDPVPMYYSVSAFNYTDVETGIAAARPNTISYETPEGARVRFEILDGETILDSYETEAVSDTRYNFKTAILPKADTYYNLRITYMNADGSVIDVKDNKISKVKRPTMLKPDGTFVTKEGKEIAPVIGYHIGTLDNLGHCADMGINVVQWNPGGNADALKKALDQAYAQGVYVAVLLYDNGLPAGHETNVTKTTNIINACKDHPAVFAWMVQDEAYWANPNCYPDLFASYELIHGLDPDHPVYLLETSDFFAIEVAGVCDAYVADPYVYNSALNVVSKHVKANTEVGSVLGRPHYSILQAMDYGKYAPDSNGMRHQAYQALMAGTASVGYYAVNAEMGNPNLWESKRYEGIKAFDTEELEDARKALIKEEYPTFAKLANPEHDVWYTIYVKDNELYMILLNMSDKETVQADIPLVSGGAKVGKFTAEPVDISGADPVSGDGRFVASLAPGHVAKYKITTEEPVNFSLMAESQFSDLAGYDWAEEAILTLGGVGIVEGDAEGNYNPAVPITRGDFAKYLIRTLGLYGGEAEDFADVTPDSHYYKEIMTGKALGILNGVGNNLYNPEATISRQDLMTICARALEYVGKLEKAEKDTTADFSDGGEIADYAKEAVSGMIWNGIIAGNADGTINPLGNTTRAEAAVIMHRIFNHKIFILQPEGFKG